MQQLQANSAVLLYARAYLQDPKCLWRFLPHSTSVTGGGEGVRDRRARHEPCRRP